MFLYLCGMNPENKKPVEALAPGTTLHGRDYVYVIKRVLGTGTFGITYLATLRLGGNLGQIETDVALKEFYMKDICGRLENGLVTVGSESTLFGQYRRKFVREADNLSKLHHSMIVKVFESFEANGTAYYAMEYLGGGTLDAFIARKGRLDEATAENFIRQIGAALTFMHEHNMLHLDVKPANIMMRSDTEPVLIDFGLSRQTDPGGKPETTTSIGSGTQGYAPIEQMSREHHQAPSASSDVYALAATLYKMLTGERPPAASKVLNDGLPAHEGISGRMKTLVRRGMAPRKADRPESIDEWLGILDEYSGKNDWEAVVVGEVVSPARQHEEIVVGEIIGNDEDARILHPHVADSDTRGKSTPEAPQPPIPPRPEPAAPPASIVVDDEDYSRRRRKSRSWIAAIIILVAVAIGAAAGWYYVFHRVNIYGSYNEGLATCYVNGMYGYADEKGDIVIKPQWDGATDFSEGLAAVKRDGKFGYINRSGVIVIEPQFDNALGFRNGHAQVKINGQWHTIDVTGNIVSFN